MNAQKTVQEGKRRTLRATKEDLAWLPGSTGRKEGTSQVSKEPKEFGYMGGSRWELLSALCGSLLPALLGSE